MGLQTALQSGAVRVDAHNLHRRAVGTIGGDGVGPPRIGQQFGQMLLQPFGAPTDRRDVQIAALRAGTRHRLGKAAVVAAQAAVNLVEHTERAAMRARAFPVTRGAMQHRGVAAPVQKYQALLAARDTLPDRVEQRRGDDATFGLVAHVHAPHQRQPCMGANAAGHLQAHITATLFGGAAMVPAFQ